MSGAKGELSPYCRLNLKKTYLSLTSFFLSLLQVWKTKNVDCECGQTGRLTNWETIHMRLERGINSQQGQALRVGVFRPTTWKMRKQVGGIYKCERRLTGKEGCLLRAFSQDLRDLKALTSAIRSKRWTSVSTKLSCLPFESYFEHGMSVAKGVPKYEGKLNVFDTMITLRMKDGDIRMTWSSYRWYAVNFIRYESSIGEW